MSEQPLDHLSQPNTLHSGPLNIMTIDPRWLENFPTEGSTFVPFQSAILPIPGRSDELLPDLTHESVLSYHGNTTISSPKYGKGPNDTLQIWDSDAPQNKQATRQQFTNTKWHEQDTNKNTTLEDIALVLGQSLSEQDSEQGSQLIAGTLPPHVASSATLIKNPQPDIFQSQPQLKFQSFINGHNDSKHSRERWENLKPIIEEYYLRNDATLPKLIEFMEKKHGFFASARMFKLRLSQWGMSKNIRRRDAISMLHKMRQRAAIGKGTILKRNGKEVNIERYMKRGKVTEYDLMDLDKAHDIPRGVELRTPSPSNNSATSPPILQLRGTLLFGFKETVAYWKNINAEYPWTAARYHLITSAMEQLTESYICLSEGRTKDFGVMLRLAFTRITKAFDAMSPICILTFVLGFSRFPHAGISDIIWRYLTCLTRERYSESHPTQRIFSSIYQLLRRHGFAIYQDFLRECLPPIVEIMIGAYNLLEPFVVDSVVKLAVVFRYGNRYQLEMVLDGLKKAEMVAAASNHLLERLAIRNHTVDVLNFLEDDTSEISQLSLLQENLQYIEAAEKSDWVGGVIRPWKMNCLSRLAVQNRLLCKNSPARFNPRHELARDLMERAIGVNLTGCRDRGLAAVIWKLNRLLAWHYEAGDHARAEDVRRRRDHASQLLFKWENGWIGDEVSVISDLDGLQPLI